jgi:hypothetical protein
MDPDDKNPRVRAASPYLNFGVEPLSPDWCMDDTCTLQGKTWDYTFYDEDRDNWLSMNQKQVDRFCQLFTNVEQQQICTSAMDKVFPLFLDQDDHDSSIDAIDQTEHTEVILMCEWCDEEGCLSADP